jgi:protein-disulfide isomerase
MERPGCPSITGLHSERDFKMTKWLLASAALVLTSAPSFAAPAGAPSGTPWLDKQLAKQRFKCPPGKSPFRGPADAQVTITEFVDYECPYCSQEETTIKKVLAAYPTQVRVVVKHLPLDMHPKAKQKALVADCMGLQDKFWVAHERFLSGAKKVREGADQGKLNADIAQGGDGQVDRDMALAKQLGLVTTPAFVIDGIRQGGTIGFEQFKKLIDAELTRKAAKAAASGTAPESGPESK